MEREKCVADFAGLSSSQNKVKKENEAEKKKTLPVLFLNIWKVLRSTAGESMVTNVFYFS